MNADATVKSVDYGDLKGAVTATIAILKSGEELSMENYEQLARKGGEDYITALNKALVKAGLAKE